MTKPKRKSKPWVVIVTTAHGGQVRTEHTSEAKAYERVRALRGTPADSAEFSVAAIRVEQWEAAYDRWVLFDKLYPEES